MPENEATQEPKEKSMAENESSIVQSSLTKSADTTHIDSKKEENNELDIGVLGYKRLRKKGEKLKSPYVVNKNLRERLKNTLPVDHFNLMKPAPDDVVNAFASYMLKEPFEVISLGQYEPITYEFMQVMVKTAEWLTDAHLNIILWLIHIRMRLHPNLFNQKAAVFDTFFWVRYEWGIAYPEAKNVVEVDEKAYGGVGIDRSYDAIFLG
ncbi:hypothetical protein FNV43_RR02451 [Rhamnella rubrinervis]|uniref:Uncharacterized protein n=1 Tax=Rhamnella rubrinervis TaxID=2594499 RepID=A0A8K0MT86_9ROSA|nr:hypothetical protein FNV43_RR02451 [Rhamnella rubrinervis]